MAPCPIENLGRTDGSLRKTNKSVLLAELEKMVGVHLKLQQLTTSTISTDHITPVHMTKSVGASTLDEMALKYYQADHCSVCFERLSSFRCCVWPILQSLNQSWREGETRCVYGPRRTNPRASHSCSKAVAKVYIANVQNKENLCTFMYNGL